MNAILKKKFFRRKEQAEIQSLNQKLTEPAFLIKKDWVIATVKYKLKLIDLNLSDTYNRKIMQKVEYRVKKADSIARKLIKKGYPVTYENAKNKLNDIIGIRVVCLYSDDVYKISDRLKLQKDFTLIKEKDYIKAPKKSGYQSLHFGYTVDMRSDYGISKG